MRRPRVAPPCWARTKKPSTGSTRGGGRVGLIKRSRRYCPAVMLLSAHRQLRRRRIAATQMQIQTQTHPHQQNKQTNKKNKTTPKKKQKKNTTTQQQHTNNAQSPFGTWTVWGG